MRKKEIAKLKETNVIEFWLYQTSASDALLGFTRRFQVDPTIVAIVFNTMM